MNIVKTLKSKENKPAIVVGIDASSSSVACSVFSRTKTGAQLLETAKFTFPSKYSMRDKLAMINEVLPAFFERVGKVDHVVIEQTIYIQSPQTSRILSYIVGHVWGKCLEFCEDVRDVPIMTWKSHIGYKSVSKAEKEAWKKELGTTEANKKAASERKERTIRIVHDKIDGIDHIIDNDVCDAIAIGLWALDNV